jgi:glutamine amidotransferase
VKARIALVDYDMGNLRSVRSALERLGARPEVTSRAEDIATAAGGVLPGVGAFGDCARALDERGLTRAVADAARAAADGSGRPFLGICLGLQLLFAGSEEAPGVAGLDVLPGSVRRFPARAPDGAALKVPHMGWNSVEVTAPGALVSGVADGEYFYFVHSFYAVTGEAADTALACEYGGVRFAAMVARGALAATQFHPEKSQGAGLELLGAFVEACR